MFTVPELVNSIQETQKRAAEGLLETAKKICADQGVRPLFFGADLSFVLETVC